MKLRRKGDTDEEQNAKYIFSYLLSAHVDKIAVSGGNIDPGLEAVHNIQNISVAMAFEDFQVHKNKRTSPSFPNPLPLCIVAYLKKIILFNQFLRYNSSDYSSRHFIRYTIINIIKSNYWIWTGLYHFPSRKHDAWSTPKPMSFLNRILILGMLYILCPYSYTICLIINL